MDIFELFLIFSAIFTFLLVFSCLLIMRRRIKNNLFLKTGMGFLLTFSTDYLLFAIFNLFEPAIAFYFVNAGLIIINLIFFFGYLFYEALLSVSPSFWRLLVMYSLLFLSCGLVILNTLGLFPSEPLLFFSFLIGSAFSLFGIRVTRRTLKIMKHPGLKIDLLSLSILMAGTLLAGILGLIRSFTELTYEEPSVQILFILIALLIMGAFFILGVNSYFHGDYIHLMPVKIYSILLYNQGGLLVYHREIYLQDQSIFRLDDGLVSGALSAFSGFFKKTLGTKAKLSFVKAGDYEFMFSPLPEEKGTCVLIVSNANYYLKRFLRNLTNEMPQTILENLDNPLNFSKFESIINDHVKKSIPYIEFRDLE